MAALTRRWLQSVRRGHAAIRPGRQDAEEAERGAPGRFAAKESESELSGKI